MAGSPPTLLALRQLLSERFPQPPRPPGGLRPTGSAGIDQALGGGLRGGLLTELVSEAPSSGGQSLLAGLLAVTRRARARLALVDGADGFDPAAVPPDCLRHLVWVRCENSDQAFAAADILVRDGNYAAVVLDVRGLPERSLRRTPASVWYRLQRAAESGSAAVLVQTDFPLVPAVPWRLRLEKSLALAAAGQERGELAAGLAPALERGAAEAAEEQRAG